MCTYQNYEIEVGGSAKASSWFRTSAARVYFDHPVHAFAEHTLNIDVSGSPARPDERAALELDAASARRLAETILAALDAVPTALLDTSVLVAIAGR